MLIFVSKGGHFDLLLFFVIYGIEIVLSLFLALREDGVDVGGAVALAQSLVLLAERPVHDLAALHCFLSHHTLFSNRF